jgi:PTS system nitrogen regulatory IIA component
VDIGDLLDRGGVSARVSATAKRQVLSVISEIAARTTGVEASEVMSKLLQRERLGSTGVGHGVAIPHARLKGLDRMRGVFVRLETPVEYGSVDDQPVDLIFALLAPAQSRSEHLRALARVSRALRQADLREQIRQARSADAIYALLSREARPSAA